MMADIEAGKIDVVVIYKIDRLTRSLTDFSRLIEVFERNKVSFVSVTQQFNTTTSMGRLMLNILLSFAQFEREVTGERIRDKISASKAKGMWMGGPLPLGYDVQNRLLVVNESEARLVKRLFQDFVRCRSTTDMVRELAADGQTTKSGRPISKAMLYKLMHNRIYLGEILHKGKHYPGQHRAIINQALWDAAHAVLAENNRQRASETWQRRQPPALLLGLFFTQDGERFQPAFTQKANGKMYRYYVPIRKVRFGANATRSGRLPAEPIEQLVLAQIHAALKAPEVVQAVCDSVAAATPEVTEPEVVLALRQLGSVWEQLFPVERQRGRGTASRHDRCRDARTRTMRGGLGMTRIIQTGEAIQRRGATLTTMVPIHIKRHGGRKVVISAPETPEAEAPEHHVPILNALARAYHWQRLLDEGRMSSGVEIAREESLNQSSVNELLRLTLLSPEMVLALLAGRQPKTLTLRWLKNHEMPPDWGAQREAFGRFDK